LFYRFAS